MPTIVRKSFLTVGETRREVFHAIGWQVRSSLWSPPTDVYETEDSFVVRMEIAGMRDKDLEVAVQNNILMISGSRPDLNERRAYRQMEIQFGKFEVAVELSMPIDLENAGVEYQDGFLIVSFPKTHSEDASG